MKHFNQVAPNHIKNPNMLKIKKHGIFLALSGVLRESNNGTNGLFGFELKLSYSDG